MFSTVNEEKVMISADSVAFLHSIDPLTVINKIKHFRSLNIRDMSESEIFTAINDTLCCNGRFVYFTNNATYPEGSVFYRVRRLEGNNIPFSELKTISGFWEPPAHCVKNRQRLNKVGESLLYVTPSDPQVPLRELHIPDNEYYALIKYVARQPVKVNVIGGQYDYQQLGIFDEKAILIHELYNSFLKDEFSRDVAPGLEHLYAVSEIIAKSYFDLPPRDIQDAWAYSSVQDKNKYNVCFRPDIAHEILHLKGAAICKNIDSQIQAYCIAATVDNTKDIQYFRMNTDIQRERFPEITCN